MIQPSGTERDILKVVAKLKKATPVQIQREVGFSTSYINYLCKFLVRNDFLLVSSGGYSLTPGGVQAILSQVGGEWLRIDKNLVSDVASQVALRLGKERKEGIDKKSVLDIATKVANEMASTRSQKVDKETIKEIATLVAAQISSDIKKTVQEMQPLSEIRKAREETVAVPIQIKTEFEFPVEDETIHLESNIGKIGARLEEEEEGDVLDKSIKLLRSIGKDKKKGKQ